MREVPKATISDRALNKPLCREAIEAALEHPEPAHAFDRQSWMEKTKALLRRHAASK